MKRVRPTRFVLSLPRRLGPACRRALVRGLALGLLLTGPAALAATEELPRDFAIPAGAAETTLRLFAEQSRVQIIFSPHKVQGVRTQAVQGAFAPRAALGAMLAGTELRAIFDATTDTITLARTPASGSPAILSPRARPAVPPAGDETVRLSELTVVGTIAPRRRLDSAVAITTLDAGEIDAVMPRSEADVFKRIPGFYVEASGGEVRANVFARGFSSVGGYEFVSLQEDGLPVISESNVWTALPDLFVRLSNWTRRIENVRGGTAGVFQNSAAGGIINLIGREGGTVPEGALKIQTSDYAQIRADAWVAGPLAANTTGAAGFTFRRDDGIRPPGYTANEGCVFHANLRHTFAERRGFLKISAMGMDDRTSFYVPIPLRDARDPQSIPGGIDLHTGTVYSPDLRHIPSVPTPEGELRFDLADGAHVRLGYLGSEFEFALADRLTLQNRNRYTKAKVDQTILLLGSAATPLATLANAIAARAGPQFAAARDLAGNYHFRLSYPGQAGAAIPDPASLNGNGLGLMQNCTATATEFEDFQNDLRLVQLTPGGGALAAGLYTDWLRDYHRRWGFSFLTEVRDQPRRLDVEMLDAATGVSLGPATYGGLRQFSVPGSFIHTSGDQVDVAPYLNFEQSRGRWTFDAGLRHEMKTEEEHAAVPTTYNLNAPGQDNPALRNAGFASGAVNTARYSLSATVVTVGANVAFSPHAGAYARAVSAYRLPDFNTFYTGAVSGTRDPGPINRIHQLEAGVKYAQRTVSVFATLIGSQLSDQLFSGLVAAPDGSLAQRNVYRDTESLGLELEAFFAPVENLLLHFVGTEQAVRFASDVFVAGTDSAGRTVVVDIRGNRPVRIPNRYFTVSAAYGWPATGLGRVTTNLDWEYVGERKADEANRTSLAGYHVFSAGVSLATTGRLTWRLQVQNLLNGSGLTEGDPRTAQIVGDPDAKYFNARPVLPRTVAASVEYSF